MSIPGIRPDWRADAACLAAPTEIWWDPRDPDQSASPAQAGKRRKSLAQRQECRTWCDTCPVRTECIIEAVVLIDRGAVRGGLRMWEQRDYGQANRIATQALGQSPLRLRHALGLDVDWVAA